MALATDPLVRLQMAGINPEVSVQLVHECAAKHSAAPFPILQLGVFIRDPNFFFIPGPGSASMNLSILT